MKDKNVIVTGGLGFIGSHIVDSLLEDNKVTIIDNMSTGKLENLENPNHENLSIIEEDLDFKRQGLCLSPGCTCKRSKKR